MIWDKLKEIDEKLDRLLDGQVGDYNDPDDVPEEPPVEEAYPEEPVEKVAEKVLDVPTPEEVARTESREFDLKHAHTPPPEKVVKKKYVPKEDDLDIPDEKDTWMDV